VCTLLAPGFLPMLNSFLSCVFFSVLSTLAAWIGLVSACASQVEESHSDSTRVAVVFSSQGLPYSMGRAALDALETTYDLIFSDVETKDNFVADVGVGRMHWLGPLSVGSHVWRAGQQAVVGIVAVGCKLHIHE
jgi:hypothetical protein